MERSFEASTLDYLKRILQKSLEQEETSQIIVPDSFPDVGRVVDCFGTVCLRSKEIRSGSVTVSCGIDAGILYVPEDGGEMKRIETYLPVTVRMDAPDLQETDKVQYTCQIKAMDCRLANSRKLLLRVSLLSFFEAFTPAQTELYRPDSETALQTLQSSYPVILPAEYQEKSFSLSEESELPPGQVFPERLEKCQPRLEVTECRLAGDKAMFKGSLSLRLLYTAQSGEPSVWSFEIPFSQYVQLDREYGEEEAAIELALTGLEAAVSPQLNGFTVSANLLAQCLVSERKELTLVEDAYSVTEDFQPHWVQYEPMGRIDRQLLHQTVRAEGSGGVKRVLDSTVFLGEPVQTRQEDQLQLQLPISANVLWEDEDGQLQGMHVRTEAKWELAMAEGCVCWSRARLEAEPYAAPAGGGAELRCQLAMTAETYPQTGARGICGGEETPRQTGQLPAVVVRAVEPEETFWSVAKSYHTTVEAILQANPSAKDRREEKELLLIPLG